MTKHIILLAHQYGDTIDRVRETYIRRNILVQNFQNGNALCADIAALLKYCDTLKDENGNVDLFVNWLKQNCSTAKFFFRLGVEIEHLHLEIYDDREFFDYQMRWQKPK